MLMLLAYPLHKLGLVKFYVFTNQFQAFNA